MGLDVSAYSKLTPAPDAERDEDGELVDYDTYIEFSEDDDFPGRLEGITPGAAYRMDGESDDFRAGSYSYYNEYRNELAKLGGWPGEDGNYCGACWDGAEGAFSEQINFTDCDGTLGPVVSAKLAKDYAAHAEKAEQVGGEFWELYQLWQRAFTLAADGGVVIFA